MASLNKVLLIGNVGHDPEVHHTEAGTPVVNLSIATTNRWTDPRNSERRERTDWHRVVVWGRQAEVAGKYLRKGGSLFVEGLLQTREWQDRDGNQRSSTEVRAQRVQLLGRRAAKSIEDTGRAEGESIVDVAPDEASHDNTD